MLKTLSTSSCRRVAVSFFRSYFLFFRDIERLRERLDGAPHIRHKEKKKKFDLVLGFYPSFWESSLLVHICRRRPSSLFNEESPTVVLLGSCYIVLLLARRRRHVFLCCCGFIEGGCDWSGGLGVSCCTRLVAQWNTSDSTRTTPQCGGCLGSYRGKGSADVSESSNEFAP